MTLTPSRRAKLILLKVLEYAEIGGMSPNECGTTYIAVAAALEKVGEPGLEPLATQVQKVLNSNDWKN